MDKAEKFAYMMGVMDTWELYSRRDGKTDVDYKKAFIVEKVLPIVCPGWTDDQVNQFYEEIRKDNVAKIISDIMKQKMDHEAMQKALTKSKIDWSSLLK